jgi:hypothetical protein
MSFRTGYYGVLPVPESVNNLRLLESADLTLFRGETFASAAFEWVAILRERSMRDPPPQSDRVDRSMFGEAAKHGQLRGKRVTFDCCRERSARLFLNPIHGVINICASGIAHDARVAPCCRGSLRAQEGRFHRVNIDHNVRERRDNFLVLG